MMSLLLWWRVRMAVRWILMWRSPVAYLDYHCPDWTMHNRDWPRCLVDHGVMAHYQVFAAHFWDCGSGIGRTPWQAARRAVRHLHNKQRSSRSKQLSYVIDF